MLVACVVLIAARCRCDDDDDGDAIGTVRSVLQASAMGGSIIWMKNVCRRTTVLERAFSSPPRKNSVRLVGFCGV